MNMYPVETARAAVAAPSEAPASDAPIRVHGKFLFAGERKLFIKGVTYGPFAVGSHGAQFPEFDAVAKDFAMMAAMGVNTVRVFTPPPIWLLDTAAERGLKVLAGLPWSQHIAFLDSAETQRQSRDAVVDAARGCNRHPAILAYLIGNEIPPDMVRWHGPVRVRSFLQGLAAALREVHPGALVSYANFP